MTGQISRGCESLLVWKDRIEGPFRPVGFFFIWPQDADMTTILPSREERRLELKRIGALPNGRDKLFSILTGSFIPFAKLPIGTLMIEAILDFEYRGK